MNTLIQTQAAVLKTNDLKKGDTIRLRNGWYAVIADNLKGNTRMATVYGNYVETGSVYSHNIVERLVFKPQGEPTKPNVQYLLLPGPRGPLKAGAWETQRITHTPAQLKLRAQVGGF